MINRVKLGILWILLLCWSAPGSIAVTLPSIQDLQKNLKIPRETIKVIEPHLSHNEHPVYVDYVGYRATQVFDYLFGPSWKDLDADIEFRALDGYVSRIEISRFKKYNAFLVVGIKDKQDFVIDNVAQNQKHIPLGPYYLIWDNIASPLLLTEGASGWPYQVNQINISTKRMQVLLPGKFSAIYSEHANLTQKYCLSCHQVNGYGGDKSAINLAAIVKKMKAADFQKWVLFPSTVNPQTAMPPLPEFMPESTRIEVATKIYHYLNALPVINN